MFRCRHWTALILVMVVCGLVIKGQIRPKSVDEGSSVTVVATPTRIKAPVRAPSAPARPKYNWLILRTYPADAEIRINDKLEGKATNGTFTKELLIGRSYNITASSNSGYETAQKTVLIKAGRPASIDIELKSNSGILKIVTAQEKLDAAKVFINDTAVAKSKLQIDQPNDTLTINDVPLGPCKITFDNGNADYVIVERKFDIKPGSEYTWAVAPKLAAVPLLITTEPGTTVYLDNEPKGTTTPEGKLQLNDVKIGRHEVRLSKEGYEDYKQTYPFEFEKPVKVAREMVPLSASAEFHDSFDVATLNRWTVPTSGFSVNKGRLVVSNAPTLGYATNIRFRDFVMVFHVRMENAGGAAWALRVKDQKNYYLFYLSGPKGVVPNRFLTYLVQDGRFDPQNPVDSVSLETPVESGGEYLIEVTASKNQIEHRITPAATGVAGNLGIYTDTKSTLPIGGIGFRTIGSEKFSVDDLYAQPKK